MSPGLLFERGSTYGIDDALQKSKMSNELERGGIKFIYGMTYETYIYIYIYIYIHTYIHRSQEHRLTSVGLTHPN